RKRRDNQTADSHAKGRRFFRHHKKLSQQKQQHQQQRTCISFFADSRPNIRRQNAIGAKSVDDAIKKAAIVNELLGDKSAGGSAGGAAVALSLAKPGATAEVTRRLALDCEFVGCGYQGKDNMLARVSIVNQFGTVLLDKFVQPTEPVTDYRTRVSGITARLLQSRGEPFSEVHAAVAQLLRNRILIGHAVKNDLKALRLDHPKADTRDTQTYRPFRALFNGGRPGLKALTERLLGRRIQTGRHDSVTDAQATMRLYTLVKRRWEAELKANKAGKKLAATSTRAKKSQDTTDDDDDE
ncbi:hypothetical protein BOX15_Mlig004156g3, partial [Macrostomum lignano]